MGLDAATVRARDARHTRGGLTWWQTSSERARQVEQAARQEALRAQNTAVQVYLDQMSTLML
jgi:hypothetical protein